MFSAFSFGKIIKTILPGAILTVALLLLAEGAWGLLRPGTGFLLWKVPKDWITPVTAALIPLSLILGFSLNTFAWMTLNRHMRARSDAMLRNTVFAAMRKKLSEGLWADSSEYFEKVGRPFEKELYPDRPPLEYYYLPLVSLTNLNYLWESYFCWYEFDINTACALMVSALAAGFLLSVKLRPSAYLLCGVVLLLVVGCALCLVLTRAAVKNLVSYERNLVLLITSSLAKAAKNAQSPPTSDTVA